MDQSWIGEYKVEARNRNPKGALADWVVDIEGKVFCGADKREAGTCVQDEFITDMVELGAIGGEPDFTWWLPEQEPIPGVPAPDDLFRGNWCDLTKCNLSFGTANPNKWSCSIKLNISMLAAKKMRASDPRTVQEGLAPPYVDPGGNDAGFDANMNGFSTTTHKNQENKWSISNVELGNVCPEKEIIVGIMQHGYKKQEGIKLPYFNWDGKTNQTVGLPETELRDNYNCTSVEDLDVLMFDDVKAARTEKEISNRDRYTLNFVWKQIKFGAAHHVERTVLEYIGTPHMLAGIRLFEFLMRKHEGTWWPKGECCDCNTANPDTEDCWECYAKGDQEPECKQLSARVNGKCTGTTYITQAECERNIKKDCPRKK